MKEMKVEVVNPIQTGEVLKIFQLSANGTILGCDSHPVEVTYIGQ